MEQILTLAGKDIRLLLRDKSGFFFTFFFPIIMAVLFGTIYGVGEGGTRAMDILVVDEDNTDVSTAFIKQLDEGSEIQVIPSDRKTAMDRVRLGKNVAFIAINKGFGESSDRTFWGNPPEVEVGVDPSRKAEAAMLQGILMKYGAKRFQNVFSNPAKMKGNIDTAREELNSDTSFRGPRRDNLSQFLGDLDRFYDTESGLLEQDGDTNTAEAMEENNILQPLVIKQTDIQRIKMGPPNAYSISFPQGIIWGIIGVAAAFGISIVYERTRGTMQRLRIAPVSLGQILAGKAVACFSVIIANSIFLLILAFLIFKVTTTSYLALLLAVLSSAVAFTGIMMLLSVLGKTERAVGGISWAVMLIMAMLGGGMIPLMFMPQWMQSIGEISPVKWSVVSLEGAIWRGFTLEEMLQPCVILVVAGIITFVTGLLIIRRTELV